jgi:tetratricopeptide (TPR) repeat protein
MTIKQSTPVAALATPLMLAAALLVTACCGEALAADSHAAKPDAKQPVDPYKDTYANYKPPFIDFVQLPSAKLMRLSTEKGFFTLNQIQQDDRANALVKAALEKESVGQYREALRMYQLIIDKYPHELYRVSRYGVFAPVSQYCQRRILNFPGKDLEYYRTLHDARAREAFEQARRKHSLIGLSEVVDGMLATSYGGPAIAELGNAALDNGHYLAALEHYSTIREFFPGDESRLRELDLKITYARRMLGSNAKVPADNGAETTLPGAARKQLEDLIRTARPEKAPFHSQLTSEPHVGTDDYTLHPASKDPIALVEPVWEQPLPGSRQDFYVFAQPVVTENSIIYRHKNVVYAQSLLNGEYRWINDLGGRRQWQSFGGRQYPLEDLVVKNGLVYTVMSKGGPSLVALDEMTGQLRWAYGPIVASTQEEANMRFLAAPDVGPRSVFAGYVLDNIEGNTHIDSEYGVIGLDAMTGRVLWRKPICRLAPGKFSSGFAVRYRNRIRSFASPPLYRQGTVYYNTNAGAVAALDARSGRIKWLMRYPYYNGVHDATRQFGSGGSTVRHSNVFWVPHSPMFWLNQRPLLIGERLYVLPVDAEYMMCFDRRTGKVQWTRHKGVIVPENRHGRWRISRQNGNLTHLLGSLKTGELVLAYSHMHKPVELINPKTGGLVWPKVEAKPMPWEPLHAIEYQGSPCMKLGTPGYRMRHCSVPINGHHFELGARPMLSEDGKLYITQWNYYGWPIFSPTVALTVYDLVARKAIHRRRYYGDILLAYVHTSIRDRAPIVLKALEAVPRKDTQIKQNIKNLEAVIADTVPTNPHPAFVPFSRLTFKRFGVQFELRFGARSVAMVYDRDAVKEALRQQKSPEADFAKAELAFDEARYAEASSLLQSCLETMSSENQDFRAAVNQQLYRVHKRLTRAGIRSGDAKKELANCLGMSRTVTTLPDEIETLLALSEAYERRGDYASAARCLRSVVSTYGHHEFPIAQVATLDREKVMSSARRVIDGYSRLGDSKWFDHAFEESGSLLKRGLPMYFSTVSPLPKPLTLRAGEIATRRLLALQGASEDFRAAFAATAEKALRGATETEQLYHLWEYPGTPAAQNVLNRLFETAAKLPPSDRHRRMWHLADVARVCRLVVPKAHRAKVLAPPPVTSSVPIQHPQKPVAVDLAHAEGINWLVLQRRGRTDHLPQLVFVGGRVRKRLDNKFILACFDLTAKDPTKPKWRIENLRLKGAGQEPGFFEAFVHGDLVVVNGIYDVLAFEHQTGTLRWRFRVPFGFETRHVRLNGDILVLTGATETLALHVHASSPAGDVVWQQSELGDLYCPPWFVGDRYVTVRKNPYNVTVRYRATGKLIGRLELPDLSEYEKHPLHDEGYEALSVSHDGHKLAVTDGWYYVMVDTERLAIDWKRRIDNQDTSQAPAMRFELKGDHLAVVKEDYDVKTIYMLSSKTGNVLWRTDPQAGNKPQPMFSMHIEGDRLYGIGVYPGQGYYFVCRDCKTGKTIYQTTVDGYDSVPIVKLVPWNFNGRAVVRVQDRQDFELNVFDLKTGKRIHVLKEKGAGRFGQHGSVSATVQKGRLVFMNRDKLNL